MVSICRITSTQLEVKLHSSLILNNQHYLGIYAGFNFAIIGFSKCPFMVKILKDINNKDRHTPTQFLKLTQML